MRKSNIIVNTKISKGIINPNIYGQFSEHLGRCIYEGIFVKDEDCIPNVNGMRKDVISALKKLHIPVLRWPGGCFADTYHWKDGIGPKSNRKTIVNTNWGGETEDNSFGTHEFMELCDQLGCEAYISGNVGSGSVSELSDWIEYCNMGGISPMADLRRKNGKDTPWNVKYWGIGNEAWGGGGSMKPEFYANLARQYSTYMRNYDNSHQIYKIASGANGYDYNWTRTVCEMAGDMIDAISLHYYTFASDDWEHKGAATLFSRSEYLKTLTKTLCMDELIENHSRIIKQFSPDGKKIGLAVDEWGTWFDVEEGTKPGFLYQQNTIRDAIVAGINLNIFNNHCDTVVMANIAQMVNVLQALILTDGPRMLLTPTYHVFDMYQGHMGARQVESYAETELIGDEVSSFPNLQVSASEKDGKVLVTIVNLDDENECNAHIMLGGYKASSVVCQFVGGDASKFNTFDKPNTVEKENLDVLISDDGYSLDVILPKASVCALELE
ncbi:MAG: alpha-N-arabinofuranosidase [Lachnospiraceae bacterium]|nr:alpha-N-arabinofuranosidase [Lachnospiraceae bacterium]